MVAIPWPIIPTYKWTVDVEFDWGGRTNGKVGLEQGLPKILEAFGRKKIKALFFISTETLESLPFLVQGIMAQGHEIGSHGHFHVNFREVWRKENDKRISEAFLASHKSLSQRSIRYRAPKFNYPISGEFYSNRNSHVSLLKHMWLKEKIKGDTIMYLHPFDIVETKEPAPNLFCKLWYSRPKRAYETFINLLNICY